MGWVQCEIEAAGFNSIALANIPDLTAAVSAPRVVEIEYPFGQTVGEPGDVERQRAILYATLAALQTIEKPGQVVDLPFAWVGNPKEIERNVIPPPIADYLVRHPWPVRNLLKCKVPERF